MLTTMLKSKIHRATVTRTDLDYEGSLTLDVDLMEKAGMLPNEQVHVLDITNGERLITYLIEGERGSGEVGINGAAAHKVSVGDIVIIVAYTLCYQEELADHEPKVVLVDEKNRVID